MGARARLQAAVLLAEYAEGRRNFQGIDVSGADLQETVLDGADFGQSDCSGVNLRGASLRGVSFAAATLVGANLHHANLIGADLSGADLSGATTWGTRLGGTRLSGSTLSNVRGWVAVRDQTPPSSVVKFDLVRENAREATKHAGSLFLAQLTVALYGTFTILSAGDGEFLGSKASIKLPVIDVSVRTSVFFAALPVISSVLQIYYLFYHRVASRLWRALDTSMAEGASRTMPELTRYPWIGILLQQPGLAARIARIPFFTFSWMTTPLLLWIAWLKVAPFHSTVALWVRDGAPASTVFGIGFGLALLLFGIWAAHERALEYGVHEVRQLVRAFIAFVLALVAANLTVNFRLSVHQLQLVNAEVSRRPSNDEQDPVGAILPHVQLAGSKARRAYLAFANINGSNFEDANLFGGILSGVVGIDSVFTRSNLHAVKAEGASMSGTSFRDAFMGYSDFSSSDLVCADFTGAKMRKINLRNANLGAAKLVRAMLEEADLRGADLRHADLSASFISAATFEAATYDAETKFPEGIVPAGAQLSKERSPSYLCQ